MSFDFSDPNSQTIHATVDDSPPPVCESVTYRLDPISGQKFGSKLAALGLIPQNSFRVRIEAESEGAVTITVDSYADERILDSLAILARWKKSVGIDADQTSPPMQSPALPESEP